MFKSIHAVTSLCRAREGALTLPYSTGKENKCLLENSIYLWQNDNHEWHFYFGFGNYRIYITFWERRSHSRLARKVRHKHKHKHTHAHLQNKQQTNNGDVGDGRRAKELNVSFQWKWSETIWIGYLETDGVHIIKATVCIQLNRRVHNKPFERCYPYINYRNLVVGHCNIFWVFVWFWLANVNIWNRNWSTNIKCEVFESNCTMPYKTRKPQ